ncbi:MAG: YkgJ family cysteine cluster protein [Thermodesulforhabdaceae bacterium]|jgi:Fe-S-cluster containining protein
MKEEHANGSLYGNENVSIWSADDLRRHWLLWIDTIDLSVPVKTGKSGEDVILPRKRVIVQAEMDPVVKSIFARWDRISAEERFDAWERLKNATREAMKDILETCVQCGECCRRGSPVLRLEDLDLLRTERIPWKFLYTIRSGEPVTAPDKESIFFLIDERIKLREKEGSRECLFLDPDTSLCTIYDDRPLECRAQACWDPSGYMELENQPYLTRRDLFSHIEVLWDVIQAHNLRCGFEKLFGLVRELRSERSRDKASEIASRIIELVSYESHFRSFMAEQLNIPSDVLDLVFGRSLEQLLKQLGYRIRIEGDTKFLEIMEEDDSREDSQRSGDM